MCVWCVVEPERSARSTFPDLMNFRVARLNSFRRVFAHVAPIFFERDIAKPETMVNINLFLVVFFILTLFLFGCWEIWGNGRNSSIISCFLLFLVLKLRKFTSTKSWLLLEFAEEFLFLFFLHFLNNKLTLVYSIFSGEVFIWWRKLD